VFLVATAVYLLHIKKEKPIQIAAAPARPLPPGSTKALLLLANGQQVVLEDVKKGDVTTQGGATIIKLDSGVLAYHPTAGAGELLYNTVITPRGGQYQLILSDGTKVWLNAATSLRFPISFSGSERRVELMGEAYFEVKHIAGKPFRVQTGPRLVEDIGTSFNINAYPDEPAAKVTLIEGAAVVIGKKRLPLHPGQQARWQAEEEETLADEVDTEEVLAWKNGQISFMNPDFSCIMRQISRWYDVDVRYTGAVPKARFFGIVSRNVYLPTILEFFEHNNIHIRQEGRILIVTP
jgi:ferric-dicitrate binding protein FerR (iron transport regulator)